MKPTKQQLDFLSWEMGAFFHFGIRTFYEGHWDWDGKEMPAAGFNPERLNCEQWIRTIKAAGMQYAILVCKHHDGFANWPSAYSDYSVKNTLWKDGKGDVVREFVDACRKHDIKIGLYYSPAEAGFQKRSAKEYDDYFINQIGELLQNYGKIDYLWFDGCGSEGHEFDKPRIIAAIRAFQPEILIFNMWDPDTRWVGNEAGVADVTNSSLVNALDFSVQTREKDKLDSTKFLPAECDFRLREQNWFYSEYDAYTIKSVEELIGLYLYSVGNGANFLINIAPDRRGLLPETDCVRLAEFYTELQRRFGTPLAGDVSKKENGILLELDEPQLVNHLLIKEDLANGECVQSFRVTARSVFLYEGSCIYTGTTIGHKRIITFPALRASELEVEITTAQGEARLCDIQAFYV